MTAVAILTSLSGRDNAAALSHFMPRRKIGRTPRPRFPEREERDYLRGIMGLVELAQSALKREMLPRLAEILREASDLRPRLDADRLDAPADRIAALLDLIRSVIQGADSAVRRIVDNAAAGVSRASSAEVSRMFRAAFGIDILATEPWLEAELRAFVTTNVNMIQSIPAQFLGEVERIVFDAARSGIRHEEIAQILLSRPYGLAEKRAAFIASDQVGKFYASLTELRYLQAGVQKYTYRTAGDARVRPEHATRDGKVYTMGHVFFDGKIGMAPRCRCVPEPKLEALIDEEGGL